MILITTNRRDLTCDYVIAEIRKRGREFLRINTESFSDYVVNISPNNRANSYIKVGSKTVAISEISAGYYRRPAPIELHNSNTDAGLLEYRLSEWNALLRSFYRLINNRWLNPPWRIFAAEDKIWQLFLASELGFKIPATLIGNDHVALDVFRKENLTIAKTIRTPLIINEGEEKVIFTTQIEQNSIIPPGAFSTAPLIMQKEIKKKFDLRVTVVGNKVFPASIDSQTTEETSTDWRKGTNTDLPHEKSKLPKALQTMCIEFVRRMGLSFGAIDLIEDCEGEYWFLECNPNGQWAWIENRTGFNITEAIVDKLIDISETYRKNVQGNH